MSDGAVILACFGYFQDCPWLCLTKAREAKVARGDLATGSIRGSIGDISTKDIFI